MLNKLIVFTLTITSCIALAQFTPHSGPSDASVEALPDAPVPQNKWDIYIQGTVIPQGHGPFHSPYVGYKSLLSETQVATSISATLFLGYRLNRFFSTYFNAEMVAGQGINKSVGMASYPNQEVFRLGDAFPTLTKDTVARAYGEITLPLSGSVENIPDQKNQLGGEKPMDRVTIVIGKFALPDYFDLNSYSHDARTQFKNWIFVDNGAWDYMSDTHGYTQGVYSELNHKNWALRGAIVNVPRTANGPAFDWNVLKAHGENVEFEYRYSVKERRGILRILGYSNQAQMRSYGYLVRYLKSQNPPPFYDSLTDSGDGHYRNKSGVGLSYEQPLTDHSGVFARLGWNDGQNTTFAFTPVDHFGSGGFSTQLKKLKRPNDTAGIAGSVSGLSEIHKDFLLAGGHDFNIGDDHLKYGKEMVAEGYYSAQVYKGLEVSFDAQELKNPSYNRERGPVAIFAVGVHYETGRGFEHKSKQQSVREFNNKE